MKQIACLVLLLFDMLLFSNASVADNSSAATQNTTKLTSLPQNEENKESDDPARQLFQRLFKHRRAEHLEAVKGLLRLNHFERQYKMVSMISEKIFGLVLRLPELVQPLLSAHHDWEILLHWSLSFCSETRLLDTSSVKLLHLVHYINPYRTKAAMTQDTHKLRPEVPDVQSKPKRRKQIKKGPQLSRHAEL
ncbi:hypothetical protein B566_EDAN007366 [Ephemera danica]|nr:hypothetical protein B566_EDAN007366 [Ephemera danica]